MNEDCFAGDFISSNFKFSPMAAFDAPAMDRETGFACRSGVADRLGWLAACHVAGFAQSGANFIRERSRNHGGRRRDNQHQDCERLKSEEQRGMDERALRGEPGTAFQTGPR